MLLRKFLELRVKNELVCSTNGMDYEKSNIPGPFKIVGDISKGMLNHTDL